MSLRPPKQSLYPVRHIFWVSIAGITAFAWFLPLSSAGRMRLLATTAASGAFVLLLYSLIIPRYGLQHWVNYLGIAGAVAIVAGYAALLQPYHVHIEVLYLAVAALSGLLRGRVVAFQTVLLAAAAEGIRAVATNHLSTAVLFAAGLQIMLLLLAGILVSSLAGIVHQQNIASGERNRGLALMLEVSMIIKSDQPYQAALQEIARKLVDGVPVTVCRIYILNESQNRLILAGVYPLEGVDGWQANIKSEIPLEALPKHRAALELNQPWVARKLERRDFLQVAAQEQLFFNWVNTLCLLPLSAHNQRLGLIAIGDQRNWENETFTRNRLELLQAIASEVSVAIYNNRLYQEAQQQSERLAVLNKVGQAIGSTIEMDALLELLYEQLSKVIPTETYFVALLDEQQQMLNVHIMIDDGERYKPLSVPADRGLGSWVLQERRPLLVRHLDVEIDSLPVKPVVIGQERMSQAWLGVPLLAGEHLLGLIATASYQPYAFSDADVSLLSNLAAQAALAIDNARHHAAVEEQARRDSLTGAYNHRHLLLRLEEGVALAGAGGAPLSLIMLDIDYFKDYNDTYGHVLGDEVLCLLVKAIQEHIKERDTLGRWGGEEFAIVLPGANNAQAMMVANRIRQTLSEMELLDGDKTPIPKPTVSQGIATFPQDAGTTASLVDIADRALYAAKHQGRDQVRLASEVPPAG